jgi:hypothetical protein
MKRLYSNETVTSEDIPPHAIKTIANQPDCNSIVADWQNSLEFEVNTMAGYYFLSNMGIDEDSITHCNGNLDKEKINQFCLWLACQEIVLNNQFILEV